MIALKQRSSKTTTLAMLLACMAVIKRNDGSLNVEAFAPSIPATTPATVSTTVAVPSDTVLVPTLTTDNTAYESSRTHSNRPSRHHRAVYDLGLGRHGPVYTPQSDSDLWNQYLVASSGSSDHGNVPITDHESDVALATQYLVEHAATRSFPVPAQPLRPKDATTIAAKPKKSHPPLIPNRITNDDDLIIRPTVATTVLPSAHTNAPQMLVPSTTTVSSATTTTTTTTTSIPFVMTRSSSHHRNDFDVNTAWMELLIYEQQQKHSANPNQSVAAHQRLPQPVSASPQQEPYVSAKNGAMALSAVHP